MSRKDDLEKAMRESYSIILECEDNIQQGDGPREKRRYRREIEEQWGLIKGYLEEYGKVVPNRSEWPQDVVELLRHFDVPVPPVEVPLLPGRTEINVMSWNIAGAKMFNHLDYPPDHAASSYVEAYYNAWRQIVRDLLPTSADGSKYPDIILLQECIGFRDTRAEPSGRWESGKRILQQIFRGYECFFFPALSSRTHLHPGKWKKFQLGSIRNFIPDYVEAQQGYGICIRDPSALRKLWVQEEDKSQMSRHSDLPGSDFELCFEVVNAVPGLYLGSRDTEPRLMVMGRIKMGSPETVERYVNLVNVHLTTLRGERTGIPSINREAQNMRLQQIDLLVNRIVSAYQGADKHRIPRPKGEQGKEDIWILGGDFNALPGSREIKELREAGFIDGHDASKRKIIDPGGSHHDLPGTKWSLEDPGRRPIVVDYIFCGLEHTSFSPGQVDISDSQSPFRPQFAGTDLASDHAVLFASFKI